jgi:hypothetical protein
MSKGRNALPAAEVLDIPGAVTVVTQENLTAANALAELDHQAQRNTAALAMQLGYDGPLDADMLEFSVAQHVRRTVEHCLEAGRSLLLLKERVAHGEFSSRLDRLGMAPRAAQKLMQACLKFSKAPDPGALVRAVGNQAKLIELLVLDDEEVQQLSAGGTVLGIDLDDVARMGSSELRHALREAREALAAKEGLITAKNAKIDQLTVAKRWKPSADSVAKTQEQQKQLDGLQTTLHALLADTTRLGELGAALVETGSPALRLRVEQGLQWAVALLGEAALVAGVSLDVEDALAQGRPGWLDHAPGDADGSPA